MSNSDLLPWRAVAQSAAQDAARIEDQARWGDARTPFDYRWEHVQAVAQLAVRLAERTGADREVCEAAAWLHDVAKAQPTATDSSQPGQRPDHGRDGAIAARRILAETDFPPAKIAAVADAIAKHVGFTHEDPVEPLEAAVLWDADKLSKLGATVVFHGLGYLLAKGQNTTEALIEQLWDEDWGTDIVDHLNTAPARMAGRARLATYRAFCKQATREYAGDDLLDESG
jgi:uncharacterized protein